MNLYGILGLFAGVAVTTGLFLAAYLVLIRKDDKVGNYFLGALFIAISLRVGKSIAYFLLPTVADEGVATGFLGLSLIGPLVLFYTAYVAGRKSIPWYYYAIHFLYPLVGTVLCFTVVKEEGFTWFYQITTVIMLFYLVKAWKVNAVSTYEHERMASWNRQILIAVSLVWIAFVYQHLTNTMMDYAIGAAIAALGIYFVFINALRSPVVFQQTMKVEVSPLHVKKVKSAFEEEDIYKIPGITINQLSEQLQVPAYLITHCVRELYKMTFPEAINHFRISEVQSLLLMDDHVKVEALAYDVGFKTPSAFYAAFKKQTGMSPKAYQQTMALKTA
ncbi:AraC family transcriptional regulator [Fulvivirga sp.]|uniref:helix-turn-helix domain-containing protein n=1 Tax=Fulvivirga sp. TaxID=1931237 RepID=UPI0032ED3205